MSSCSPCCGTKSALPVAPSAQNSPAQRAKALKAAADKVGMSVEDVEKARRAGVNLNQLATSKGIPHDHLIASITGVMDPADARRTTIAEAIAAARTPRA